MIVHPIGMMRANAASGVNFNEQWAGYTLGEPLQTEGPYERLSGALNVTTEDRSGTRVATMLDNTDLTYRYTGPAPTSNRSLTAVIHQESDLAGSYVAFYLSYIDDNNFIEAKVAQDGWINLRYLVGGTGVFTAVGLNVGAGAGDTIKLTLSGTTLTLHHNGGLLSTKTSVPTAPIANHGFRIRAAGAQTTRWEISSLHIEDL